MPLLEQILQNHPEQARLIFVGVSGQIEREASVVSGSIGYSVWDEVFVANHRHS